MLVTSTAPERIIASEESILALAGRCGIGAFNRLVPEIAAEYTLQQYNGWKTRKSANLEQHQDAGKPFEHLDPSVQQSIATLAELRLIVLQKTLSPEALNRYVALGTELSGLVNKYFDGYAVDALDALKPQLTRQAAKGEDLKLALIESTFLPVTRSDLGTYDSFKSASHVLLSIHHGLWLANLKQEHEFAYKLEDLPTTPVENANPKLCRPFGLRAFSDQANLLGIVSQMIALSKTLEIFGMNSFLSSPAPSLNTSLFQTQTTQYQMLKDENAESIIRNLDKKVPYDKKFFQELENHFDNGYGGHQFPGTKKS